MEDHRAVLVAPQLHLVGQLYQLRKVHALAETQSLQDTTSKQAPDQNGCWACNSIVSLLVQSLGV